MKKTVMLLTGVVSMLIITGCSSLETSRNFNGLGVAASRTRPIAHINVSIWGCFLFDSIPLMCGSVNSAGKIAAFKDTVDLDNAMLMLTRRARGIGATNVLDLNSRIESTWLWYTLIFWTREVQVSGTAIK